MERGNETSTTDLILLGFSPEISPPSFLISLTLLIYIVAVTGNTVLIRLIWADLRLHTPMYFLLGQLSLIDLALISTTVPKMAADFFSGRRSISLPACGTQIFFFLTLAGAECLLLTLMSFDRSVAICHPLRYPVLLNRGVRHQMVTGCWVGGAVNALIHTLYITRLPICNSREIHHFFCEVMTYLKLSCEETSSYQLGVLGASVVFILFPFGLIVASYALIFFTVLRMDSREGRRKALTTCSSHLTVVTLYFGPGIFVYVTPPSSHSPERDQGISLFSTILTPMLNPLIYSLRNQEVLGALRRVLGKCPSSE
ncbi:olfactory receptor 2L5-like [Ornithorhynchus anatinus]|uniref:olfactory receptor 2L5-like n=1 Tax=Ornithorhynchus anatinus TaxID=9258 RepID=UPI000223ED88|nr:olfactory receptor 2L5-like [Ornithorhynchus anatinus]